MRYIRYSNLIILKFKPDCELFKWNVYQWNKKVEIECHLEIDQKDVLSSNFVW